MRSRHGQPTREIWDLAGTPNPKSERRLTGASDDGAKASRRPWRWEQGALAPCDYAVVCPRSRRPSAGDLGPPEVGPRLRITEEHSSSVILGSCRIPQPAGRSGSQRSATIAWRNRSRTVAGAMTIALEGGLAFRQSDRLPGSRSPDRRLLEGTVSALLRER